MLVINLVAVISSSIFQEVEVIPRYLICWYGHGCPQFSEKNTRPYEPSNRRLRGMCSSAITRIHSVPLVESREISSTTTVPRSSLCVQRELSHPFRDVSTCVLDMRSYQDMLLSYRLHMELHLHLQVHSPIVTLYGYGGYPRFVAWKIGRF